MRGVDLAWLVSELDRLGLKLSVTPKVDGTLELSRWRCMAFWEHSLEVEALWNRHLGQDAEALAAITYFVAHTKPNKISGTQVVLQQAA